MSLITELERKIMENPGDFQLVEDLLSHCFKDPQYLLSPDKPQEYIMGAIRNFPEKNGKWNLWSTYFLVSKDRSKDAVEQWKIQILKVSNKRILFNAGIFCSQIDSEFSSSCFKKLYDEDTSNLEILEYLAKTTFWSDKKDEGFLLFKQRLHKNLDVDPFFLTEAVICADQANKTTERDSWLLNLKTMVSNDTTFHDQVSDLLSKAGIRL